MSDAKFIESIYNLGSKLVGRALTETEKSEIITKFNDSKEKNTFLRAIAAIKLVLKVEVPNAEFGILLEKSAFSIDSVNAQLAAMKLEAEKWEAEKK